jgi:hypothetical protein
MKRTKVKIFCGTTPSMENEINEWLTSSSDIDRMFSISFYTAPWGVLITYAPAKKD